MKNFVLAIVLVFCFQAAGQAQCPNGRCPVTGGCTGPSCQSCPSCPAQSAPQQYHPAPQQHYPSYQVVTYSYAPSPAPSRVTYYAQAPACACGPNCPCGPVQQQSYSAPTYQPAYQPSCQGCSQGGCQSGACQGGSCGSGGCGQGRGGLLRRGFFHR